MIEDARELPSSGHLRTKLCVIGSGIAGVLLALELERLGHDVLLLEAGNESRDKQQRDAQAGEVSGGHAPVEHVATRRLGGAFGQCGIRLAPLDPSDFEPHITRTERWPIDYTELEPYYRLAHERLDAGAFEYAATRALPAAAPLFAQPSAASSVSEHKTWRWYPAEHFAQLRERLQQSQRIRVLYNALVTELRLDVTHGRVERALAASSPRRHFEVRADTFVLAGGGLEITRLLLASRNQRSQGIGNERRHVGRHYLTHPATELELLSTDHALVARWNEFELSHDGIRTRRSLSLSERARSERGLVNLNLTCWTPEPHAAAHGGGMLTALPRRWLNRYAASRSDRVRLRLDAEQRDDAENFVKLGAERDAFGVPRLRVQYRVAERDRRSYYASLECIAAELSRSPARPRLVLPTREEFVSTAALGDARHAMGLTRMTASAADGVVDRNACVHSCPNLFIASASVFPTTGAAPPALTLAALSLRLAQHLATL